MSALDTGDSSKKRYLWWKARFHVARSGKRESPYSSLCHAARQAREFLFSEGELGQNLKAQPRPPGVEPEPWMMIR